MAMWRVVVALTIVVHFCFVVNVYAQNIPSSELSALYDLYTSTGGPSWIWSTALGSGTPWNFTGNPYPCTSNDSYAWQGVLCAFPVPYDTYYVRALQLPQHNLAGTIPNTINQLQQLTELNLYSNYITGTLCTSLCSLQGLQSLDLEDNRLSGTLATNFGNLSSLVALRLEGNSLSGPVPSFLTAMDSLIYLDLGENAFTGTLPNEWSPGLQFLDVASNHLYGTLPTELGSLTQLRALEISVNRFTGTIPPEYMSLTGLKAWFGDSNSLTGTIPNTIAQLTALRFINLGYNHFHGNLPEVFFAMNSLEYLHIFGNYLSGALPANLGSNTSLVQIYLFENMFSGNIPTSWASLLTLQELLLNNNRLTGPIYEVFNASAQTHLKSVQLGLNRLTGTMPPEIFRLPALVSLTLSVNCFHGGFPQEACASAQLLNLVLDGLHSSTTCQTKILPGVSAAYTTVHNLFNRVPACYFAIPTLLSLHLSGNELAGSLPGDLVVSPSLVDLNLAHNELRGSIPDGIQRRAWINLDLSYNHFDGSLHADFGQPLISPVFGVIAYDNTSSNTKLALQNNRLSGAIPHNLQSMRNVSMLKENIFSCAADKSDLPEKDEEKFNYNCGSTVFDTPYYVWLSFSLAVVLLMLLARVYHEKIDPYVDVSALASQLKVWVNIGHAVHYQRRMKTYNHVCDISQMVCMVSFACAALCVFVLAPLYIILSHYYGTHTHLYAWMVSAALLSGRAPFGIVLVALTGLICLLLGYYARNLNYNHRDWRAVLSQRERDEIEGSAARRLLAKARLWERIVTYAPMVVTNFAVVFSANVAFVYIVLYGSTTVLTVAQLMLSMFKLFWNKVGSRLLSRWTAHRISQKDVRFPRSEFFALQLLVAVVNNIGIPCLVIIFTSPACLYHMFVPVEPSQSHYTSVECTESPGTTCSEYKVMVHTSSYDPPFTYSYQCSASFVTYYAAAFVTVCIFSGFGTPLIQFCCMPLYPLSRSGSVLRFVLKRLVPKLLRPPEANLGDSEREMDLFRPFFDANQLLLTLLTNFAVMLTFGVVFPPLAACMAFTILSIFYFARIKVGIFVQAAEAANSPCLIDVVDRECKGVGFMPVLHRSMWTLVVVAFIFYTWFLFDALGNAEGFAGAFWVFIFVPLLPVVILPAHIWLRSDAYALARFGTAKAQEDSTALPGAGKQVDVEMATLPSTGRVDMRAGEGVIINALHGESVDTAAP